MKYLGRELTEYHAIISSINEELLACCNDDDKPMPADYWNTYDINAQIANDLKCDASQLNDSEVVDRVFSALTREYVTIRTTRPNSPKQYHKPPRILGKKGTLMSPLVVHPAARPGITPKIQRLNEEINHLERNLGAFIRRDSKCIIVTAIPVEFRAMYRKLGLVLSIQDDSLYELLDRKSDGSPRRDVIVEGVIFRDRKWVKVTLACPRAYEAAAAGTVFRKTLDEPSNAFVKEVILLGVAGQMDATNETLIGDLVVSTGFYDAYYQKSLSILDYSDKEPRILDTDFSEGLGLELTDWQPREMVETLPPPDKKHPERETRSSKVVAGRFVSGPSVVKNAKYKQHIIDNFPDARAVEMEAHGLYYDCLDRKIPMGIVKSVCDWADKRKTKIWQPYCSDLAAEFCVDYLIGKWGRSARRI
jgi:nucleoside phosphorylase